MSVKRQATSLMLLLLYALLMAALLVLVYSGASLYAEVVESRQANADRRGAVSFGQSQVAGCEAGVLLKPGPEGQMLCLPEEDTGYETRIFLRDGALRTSFVPCDTPADAETGDPVCSAERFALTWQTDALLRIDADGVSGFAACRRGDAYDG